MRENRHRHEELQLVVDQIPDFSGGQGSSDIVRAVVTTAIPTGTIGSPSTAGRAQVYQWDSDAGTSSTDSEADPVRVCNDHTLSASIGTGKCIKIAFIDGDYWLIAADC